MERTVEAVSAHKEVAADIGEHGVERNNDALAELERCLLSEH